jgi:predicted small integral membrane protein
MILRAAKMLLVFGVAIFYTLVVLNNTTDYGSNYEFVRHVMMMDSTFAGNHAMWRAINTPWLHHAFYVTIIAWEFLTMALCWWGGTRMGAALDATSEEFGRAKSVAIVGLTVGVLMWLVAFLAIGGEWYLMWQSAKWNGQEAAFRMFAVAGIVLVLVAMPDGDSYL